MSLYGEYGNFEDNGDAIDHNTEGHNRAAAVQPLNGNGDPDPNGKIGVLFLGFSNCAIEVCGGASTAWNLVKQPCATKCPNLFSQDPLHPEAWNQATDGFTQRSVLYQLYGESGRKVGSRVFVLSGAYGGRHLALWDPVAGSANTCPSTDRECEYNRVKGWIEANGFSEKQIQIIFLYTSTNYPECDASFNHGCDPEVPVRDFELTEKYLGDIMRYLKATPTSRYPHLQQVFLIGRNYAGYAQNDSSVPGDTHGCLSPEPFSYEQSFGIQKLIVAQIKQAKGHASNDSYAGQVDYNNAPWFDWGPYLWSNGNLGRNDGLRWCDNNDPINCLDQRDFRWGKPALQLFGDLTHPSTDGQGKAADKIVNFLLNSEYSQDWVHYGN